MRIILTARSLLRLSHSSTLDAALRFLDDANGETEDLIGGINEGAGRRDGGAGTPPGFSALR